MYFEKGEYVRSSQQVNSSDKKTFVDNEIKPGTKLEVIDLLVKVRYGNKTMIVSESSLDAIMSETSDTNNDFMGAFSNLFGGKF